MGIVDEEVWITINSSNMNYYKNLGYEIPKRKDKQSAYKTKRGTKILVKVSDLSKGCNHTIRVKCDKCGEIKDVRYAHYYKINRDGLYYCHTCATKLNSGKNHYHWDNSITDEERICKRNIDGYTEFVKSVMLRDNYTCQCCGKKSSRDLEVHHLNSYNWYKEGRVDPSNGVTLCGNCHSNFHMNYGHGNNTKEQFEEWFGHALGDLGIYQGELPIARKVYCIEDDKVYNSVKEFSKTINASHEAIYSVCNKKSNSVYGKHLLWYDEYLQMTEEDIQNFLNNCIPKHYKKVVCITTGKIFLSSKDGVNYYNCSNHIIDCCKGKRKYCGKLPDGTKLQWMYYDDYLKTLEDEQEELSKIDVA